MRGSLVDAAAASDKGPVETSDGRPSRSPSPIKQYGSPVQGIARVG